MAGIKQLDEMTSFALNISMTCDATGEPFGLTGEECDRATDLLKQIAKTRLEI